jgi:uncharacterized Zn finger protein
MTEYSIREVKHNTYELAKFEDSADPVAIYTLSKRGCSCPARSYNCKHRTIFSVWESMDKPIGTFFDELGRKVGSIAYDSFV